jgi:HD-like signal output (HDOD) protein
MVLQAAFPEQEIKRRIEAAPRLASLRSINVALNDLVYAENSFTSQIAEIIRRDPSLTSRLLKLVNSVFFGLSQRVNNIEEAIFYLGLRQIRQLALATPIIEDFERMHADFKKADWHQMWRHSIGTGILTREVISIAGSAYADDTDYIAGLVHNIGKIVMASIFPNHFTLLLDETTETTDAMCTREVEVIGWNHAQIGAYFLERHHLGPEIVEPVRWHNDPGACPSEEGARLAAAIQIAEHMLRAGGIQGIERTEAVTEEQWRALSGWDILFEKRSEDEREHAIKTLSHSMQRLPKVLKGMI